MKFYCTKCGIEIIPAAGYFNYPSGIMCVECGLKRNPAVEKALNEELLRMAKELKGNKKFNL